MNARVPLTLALSLIIGALVASPAPGMAGAGTTWHVAPDGDDTAAGTAEAPFATIGHAATVAEPGSTILVHGGTYTEGEIWLRADQGQCGSPEGGMLTIAAAPGEVPLFINGERSMYLSCDHLRVEGLHFTNGKSIAIWGFERTTIELVGNHFTGPGYAYDAISTEGSNLLLEANVCDIEGNSMGTQGHCYYIHHGSDITIRGNTARGMTGYGIHVFDQRRSEDPADFTRSVTDVLIEDNIASGSEERSGIIIAASDGARISDVVIRGNQLFGNPVAGLNIASDTRDVHVEHNTIWGNGEAGILVYGEGELAGVEIRRNILDLGPAAEAPDPDGAAVRHIVVDRPDAGVVADHNLYWPGPAPRLEGIEDASAIVGDPLFRDAAGGDFRPGPGSAAMDPGADLGALEVDGG